ncbi:MAG: hypothetical protein M1822_005653 [Bathelium mastoideum]|nr:MAG: hypothetical protein M1822_005653 [Bathelium mastoideum]
MQHEPTCLENTRVHLLQHIFEWADTQTEQTIYWLKGWAGTGKSTVSRTAAREWYDQERLGASFFFSRGGGEVGHAGLFVTTIAVQLACRQSTLRRLICDAMKDDIDIASKSLTHQWRQLVLGPLSKLDSNESPSLFLLVIDALDECKNGRDVQIVLQLLAETRSLKKFRLKTLLTSRPELHIRHGFSQIPIKEHQEFALHDISRFVVDKDIQTFLEHNFESLRQDIAEEAHWPGSHDIMELVRRAGGLFIWAATAYRFVRLGRQLATKRLRKILESNSGIAGVPEEQLDDIYNFVLEHAFHSHDDDEHISMSYTGEEKEELSYLLRHVLGSAVILCSPLSIYSLSKLLGHRKEKIDRILENLHALLDIPDGLDASNRPLRLHHPSFRDFILTKSRCKDPRLWVDEQDAHQTLAGNCIHLMSRFLKQDLCNTGSPGTPITDVESTQVNRYIPLEVQYACLYWTQHLQESQERLYDNDQVHKFLQVHFLHWMEALSWMRKASEAIHAIALLESTVLVSLLLGYYGYFSLLSVYAHGSPSLYEFLLDAKRFALYHRPMMEQNPLQIYYSGIVFSPEASVVRKQFAGQIPQWIRRLPKVEKDWSNLLQTLEGHSNSITAIAFSPDGTQLASASFDTTVRLWNAHSGTALLTLKGHSENIRAIAFSPCGKQLVSASDDKTVRIWDTCLGTALFTLEGHSECVTCARFSPAGHQIASAADDNIVRLWDTKSGVTLHVLEGHSGSIYALGFSPDGKQLASASGDKTIRIWNPGQGVILKILNGHADNVTALSFSPNNKQLASASDDSTVRIWDATSEKGLCMVLKGGKDLATAVKFSPDGVQLASAWNDGKIKLWDASSGVTLQTSERHSGLIWNLDFSPDSKLLASASVDSTVRLWDVGSGALLLILKKHAGPVTSVLFSSSGEQLASASLDGTVRLWNVSTRTVPQISENDPFSLYKVILSPDGKRLVWVTRQVIGLKDVASGTVAWTIKKDVAIDIAFSPNGKQLAVSSRDTIRMLDTGSGTSTWATQILGPNYDPLLSTFSPDGKLLASTPGRIVHVLDTSSGAAIHKFQCQQSRAVAIKFSPDSGLLATASIDSNVEVWSIAGSRSGLLSQTLHCASDRISVIVFSPDGNQIASASRDQTVKLWDTTTGVLLQTLNHLSAVTAVAFSLNGQHLLSASSDKTISLWNAGSGKILQAFEVDFPIDRLSFSGDGTYVKTDRGQMHVPIPRSDTVSSQEGPDTASSSVLVKEQWITRGMDNVLWLPPEYRPTCIAVQGGVIAIGHERGHVSIFEFALDVESEVEKQNKMSRVGLRSWEKLIIYTFLGCFLAFIVLLASRTSNLMTWIRGNWREKKYEL